MVMAEKELAFILIKNGDLPIAEAESIIKQAGGRITSSREGLVIGKVHPQKIPAERLALTKYVGLVIGTCDDIPSLGPAKLRVRAVKLTKSGESSHTIEKKIAAKILEKGRDLRVDLDNPDLDILVIITEEGGLLVKKILEVKRYVYNLKNVFFRPLHNGLLDSACSRAILNLTNVDGGTKVLVASNSPQLAHEVIELGGEPSIYTKTPIEIHNALVKAGDLGKFHVISELTGKFDVLVAEVWGSQSLPAKALKLARHVAVASTTMLNLKLQLRYTWIRAGGEIIKVYWGSTGES